MTHNCQFQSVTLYISRTVDQSHHQDCSYTGIKYLYLQVFCFIFFITFLIFVNIFVKIFVNTYIFYCPTLTAFLIKSCFSSSSINAKQKFWSVPHLLHMCVILYFLLLSPLISASKFQFRWIQGEGLLQWIYKKDYIFGQRW